MGLLDRIAEGNGNSLRANTALLLMDEHQLPVPDQAPVSFRTDSTLMRLHQIGRPQPTPWTRLAFDRNNCNSLR